MGKDVDVYRSLYAVASSAGKELVLFSCFESDISLNDSKRVLLLYFISHAISPLLDVMPPPRNFPCVGKFLWVSHRRSVLFGSDAMHGLTRVVC